MTFRSTIEALYKTRRAYFLPFIGRGYENPELEAFRIAVVGINAYVKPSNMKSRGKPSWFANWWSESGLGKGRPWTHRFYNTAYDEVTTLGEHLTKRSTLFKGLAFDASPTTKSGLYATNAIKVYLPEAKFKTADRISPEMIAKHSLIWHSELDVMAAHGAFPHLVVVLGNCFWESAWRAFYSNDRETFPSYANLTVREYESAPEGSLVEHHANRIKVRVNGRDQDTLLVKVHHPSAHPKVKRNANWLLKQSDFRKLAQMA